MAVGLPTKSNWAAGDILTAAQMDDLAGTVNLLQYSAFPIMAGKNAIINGGMDIWQRGTSFAVAASTGTTYSADRWCTNTGANQAITISRQATADTTNLPNIQYALRYQRNSGQTGTSLMGLVQSLETTNSIPFASKIVTLSFYARAGANYSATSNLLSAYLFSGTGTDENRLSAPYTGNNQVALTTPTLTTTWQRFSVTGTVPATATELSPYFAFTPTGTAGANDYFEITGVQLELGSVATTFSRAGGSIGGELALCQRYLPSAAPIDITGYAYSASAAMFGITFPVTARVAPTGITTSGTFTAYALNVGTTATPAFDSASTTSAGVSMTLTITAGQGSRLAGGTILFTGCEL